MPEPIRNHRANDYAERIRERHQGLSEVIDSKTIIF